MIKETRLLKLVANIPLTFGSAPCARRIEAIVSFPFAAAICWCINYEEMVSKRITGSTKGITCFSISIEITKLTFGFC